MGITYQFDTVEDVGHYLNRLAEQRRQLMPGATTQRDRRSYSTEAGVYAECADLILKAEIKEVANARKPKRRGKSNVEKLKEGGLAGKTDASHTA